MDYHGRELLSQLTIAHPDAGPIKQGEKA